MGNKLVSETTTNRGEFNRAYKDYLAHRSRKGISCSYCKYHRNENGAGRGYYGGHTRTNGHIKMTYPNWKLVSKTSVERRAGSSPALRTKQIILVFI